MTVTPAASFFELNSDTTPFFAGVSGHTKLESEDLPDLKEQIRSIFRWLRTNPKRPIPELGHGLRLTERNPIVLLSALAPGADQIAAQVAEEFCFPVLAPLPFLKGDCLLIALGREALSEYAERPGRCIGTVPCRASCQRNQRRNT